MLVWGQDKSAEWELFIALIPQRLRVPSSKYIFVQGFRFFTVFTAAQSFYGGNLTLISLIDTKFSGENTDLHKWVMMTEDMSELRKTAFIEIT